MFKFGTVASGKGTSGNVKALRKSNAVGELKVVNGTDGRYSVPENLAGGACFVAGTQMKTVAGDKSIEDIQVGDIVYAKNTETGESGWKEVVRLFIKETHELIHVHVGDEVIDATPTHPFWVEGYGFKPAGELVAGDYVESVSPREIQDLSERMFDAANVPVSARNDYYREFNRYIYGLGN